MGFIITRKKFDVSEEEIEKHRKNLFQKATKPWDPVEEVRVVDLIDKCAKVKAEYEYFQKHRHEIRKNLSFKIIIVFIVIAVVVSFFMTPIVITFSILSFILAVSYLISNCGIDKFAKDIININVAEDEGWVYNPDEDNKKWKALSKKYVRIFNRGSSTHHIHDQFWGELGIGDKKTAFNFGLFSFETGSYASKYDVPTTHSSHYFILKLNKKINSSFNVFRANTLIKLQRKFSRSKISFLKDFSDKFTVIYDKDDKQSNNEALKLFSRELQRKIVELDNGDNIKEILFEGDVVVFLFKDELIKDVNTNILKSSLINNSDIIKIRSKLRSIVNTMSQILKTLD